MQFRAPSRGRSWVFESRLMVKNPIAESTLGITAARFARLSLDPALRERKTTSDYIADALREAIYDGQFADSEVLNQVELAGYFQVSRAPIREALRRLQAEGLVSSVAHRRAVVIGLALTEIIELIEIRAVIEGYLVEKAGPGINTRSIRRLGQLCDEMEGIETYDYNWVMKNWEFHRVMYGPSASDAGIDMAEQLHQKVERYIRRTGRPERLRGAVAEHRQILAHVKRKDFTAAGAEMKDHILNTGEEIRRHFPDGSEESTD